MAERSSRRDNPHENRAHISSLAHQIRDMIRASKRPVILTHANPDADAVASALGMLALCRTLGVEPAMTASGDGALPANLEFLEGAAQLKQINDDALEAADLLILVDCSDPSRLGPIYYRLTDEFERTRPTINIDHHVTNDRAGTLNLVVPEAAATAEIISGLFDALNVEVEPRVATELLAGVYGDTLGLRTPSTTPDTLRIAAELLESGGDLDAIIDSLFRMKPYSTVCLWAEALQRTEWRGSLIWTHVDPGMLERSAADRTEAEGIVNFLAGTIGARAAALLYQESWGWRVSMRTLADDVDVAAVLQRFGGGGHTRAAGARLEPGPESMELFLNQVAGLLGPRDTAAQRTSAGDEPV